MGVCNCSIFCCMLLCVRSSIAIILMGKRELVALLNLSSWCLVMVERLFLAVPQGCLQFVIVVFPDHTHLLFLTNVRNLNVFLEVHGRDIDFAKSEQSYHLTSTDAEAAAVRLLLPLHRKRYIPESYSIVCIYVKWH